jgi:hypothetical protein
MAIIRNLVARIQADPKPFVKGIKAARKAANAFAGDIVKATIQAGKFALKLTAVAATATAFLAKRTLDAADEQIKFGKRIGISQKALAGFELANEKAGNAAQVLRLGLQRMSRRIAEASQDMGEAQDALKELGIDAKAMIELPLEEQFMIVADALDSVKGSSDKTRLAFKLFDSEGVALINTIRGGSKALEASQEEAEDLGLALSEKAVIGIEDTKDAFTKLQNLLKGTALQAVAAFTDEIEAAVEILTEMIGTGPKLEENVARAVAFVGDNVSRLADELERVQGILNFILGTVARAGAAGIGLKNLAEAIGRGRITGLIPALAGTEETPAQRELRASAASFFADAQKNFANVATGASGKRFQRLIEEIDARRDARLKAGPGGDTGRKQVELQRRTTEELIEMNAEIRRKRDGFIPPPPIGVGF